MKKVHKMCNHCGNKEVSYDATSRWCFDTQQWVLVDTYGDPYCGKCETNCLIVTVEAEAINKLKENLNILRNRIGADLLYWEDLEDENWAKEVRQNLKLIDELNQSL